MDGNTLLMLLLAASAVAVLALNVWQVVVGARDRRELHRLRCAEAQARAVVRHSQVCDHDGLLLVRQPGARGVRAECLYCGFATGVEPEVMTVVRARKD